MDDIYYLDDGTANEVILHDATRASLPILKARDPGYVIPSHPAPKDFVPKLRSLIAKMVDIGSKAISDFSLDEFLALCKQNDNTSDSTFIRRPMSLARVLVSVAWKSHSHCKLCGRQCGINRFIQDSACGTAGRICHALPSFEHIDEESPINPAIVFQLSMCSLQCVYCLTRDVVHNAVGVKPLSSDLFWDSVKAIVANQKEDVPINTLEITNPNENFASVIDILSSAPNDFNLPIVFNCHLYGSDVFYEIAQHLVDVWLVDLRHCDRCALKLSGVSEYIKYAELGINAILQDPTSRLIVRLLILPGHVDCCFSNSVNLLSAHPLKDRIYVSILDQYVPVVNSNDYPELSRRPTKDEFSKAHTLVKKSGLTNIASAGAAFWADGE
jgi:putative pyruvate formate lyase activating enzyme